MKPNRILKNVLFYVILFFFVIAIVQRLSPVTPEVQHIPTGDLLEKIDQGQVERLVYDENRRVVTGQLQDGTRFRANVPELNLETIREWRAKGVEVDTRPVEETPWWTTLLTNLLPMVLVVAVLLFILQQTQGTGSRVMQFGKSRARLHQPDEKRRITFDDVAGYEEVKEELKEIVDYLKNPRRYIELGARIPKGVLLYGPPGTGKTHMARAVAGEAGVPFYYISGSDFVEMFVGVGASRVRDLFEQAKRNAPAIVFIDEIDAVGRQRGAGYGGGHDEREQTLNQLLVEMDGFGTNEGIIVMAATNRPDVLDPALLRPGRFDRQIVIDRPDLVAREAILKVHTRSKPLAPDVDLALLARRTPGFTGADLENLVNEAALLAARRRKKQIDMQDFEDAIDRIVGGGPERRTRVMSEKEKQRVAYHEAGHALVAKLLPNTDPVHKISIIPRGAALGYVMQLPTEDRYLITRQEILDRVTMALAGRAAEELVFGEVSTGAQDDLEKSTKMVRRMITEFGMSDELGPMTFGHKMDAPFLGRDLIRERNYSEEVAAAIDRGISEIINDCYERALRLLREHRDKLERIAQTLLEKETIQAEELDDLLRDEADEPAAAAGEKAS
ncbi:MULTISPECIES: ATP-dependent zinc metalloprotease FtsH [Thermaerobacter]|uniref:ATP-dependent zinc metalloprotease FtsH n=1 Tax=Thermaerobacter composti TaxID=554949 RepID=A0ABZ0QP36_9FIRM|nr:MULTISPECIES: ATP-dependent zinc metalloprotease FtsH [Thermaerobacter]PZN04479.1 MAG: cell division protein FtsH [Bacillota bacterium]QBS37180.1 ATP-dependent metallopeptidase FtsH/Yme1/Tma family protein [Thermaerobacter sp. FW80]WPD19191.1 ATP-dependent zinc metalloprotease FtsH [Thermaerobacter composti]